MNLFSEYIPVGALLIKLEKGEITDIKITK